LIKISTNLLSVPRVDFDEEKNITSLKPPSSRLVTYLHELALKTNDSPQDPSNRASIDVLLAAAANSTDPTQNLQNPESDSFTYLETILESLAILGKLGSALETVTQRLPMELYSLAETTIDEVKERTEFNKRLPGLSNTNVVAAKTLVAYMYVDPKASDPAKGVVQGVAGLASDKPVASMLRLCALENSASNTDHEVLRDLFWTLYSKLDAVSQSMRVIYEAANRIGSVCSHYLRLRVTNTIYREEIFVIRPPKSVGFSHFPSCGSQWMPRYVLIYGYIPWQLTLAKS
jgi:exocyst complex component 4